MSLDPHSARSGRRVALVIAAAGLLSIFAPPLTQLLGLAPRYEFLFYLFSLAGFAWALIVTWGLWRNSNRR